MGEFGSMGWHRDCFGAVGYYEQVAVAFYKGLRILSREWKGDRMK